MGRGIHRAGIFAAACCAFCFSLPASVDTAADTGALAPGDVARIDAAVNAAMKQTNVPGVSIAVVRDGKIAYLHAYGWARVPPEAVPATTETRYGIGSISKQFAAAAILLLAQDGKLGLDDPVGRYIPGLTSGDVITIRQVLNHTSGYEDFWPQDYVFQEMMKPTTPDGILDRWARKPLDFAPGTDWQYSNTNYTVVGRIVEKVSGMPLMEFLQKRIFEPLHMTGVDEDDTKPLAKPDAAGYTRVALGPLRPAPQTGPGWLFAMGELVMTPRTLAVWDISMIDRSLLAAKSYDEMEKAAILQSGSNAHYGLGVEVTDDRGRRMIGHSGEISGFLTENRVWPDQRAAVVVVVNADQVLAQLEIADRIADVVLPPVARAQATAPAPSKPDARPPTQADADARAIFTGLQQGKVEPLKLSENARAYFTPDALRDAAQGLKPLGALRAFTFTGDEEKRGGMIFRVYIAACEHGRVAILTFTLKDGRFEQFLVFPGVE